MENSLEVREQVVLCGPARFVVWCRLVHGLQSRKELEILVECNLYCRCDLDVQAAGRNLFCECVKMYAPVWGNACCYMPELVTVLM
ncbi:hypothetical protein F511_44150 [Dorcoceras hygrometricum]|uniref:Uncharacterized protein n=1 Tax=Dorcoceras hygrometricum TaxID=472368 RepID=A0A2Z7D2X2_9LAMI|nr:hypothetical protein F511_44150 [Dorcoceras hygrometricum]